MGIGPLPLLTVIRRATSPKTALCVSWFVCVCVCVCARACLYACVRVCVRVVSRFLGYSSLFFCSVCNAIIFVAIVSKRPVVNMFDGRNHKNV